MAPVAVLTLAGVLALGACATSAQRKAAENAAIQKEAAKEISRICALPEPERSAEIQRVKDEAGIVLLCGKQ